MPSKPAIPDRTVARPGAASAGACGRRRDRPGQTAGAHRGSLRDRGAVVHARPGCRASGSGGTPRRPLDLQGLLRQGQPHGRRFVSRPRAEEGAGNSGAGQGAHRSAGDDRRALRRGGRAGRRDRRHPADPGLSLPADRPGLRRRGERSRRERQEGPVSRAGRRALHRREGARQRQQPHPDHRAGHDLRLPSARRRFPVPAGDARARRPGPLRRHAQRSAARRRPGALRRQPGHGPRIWPGPRRRSAATGFSSKCTPGRARRAATARTASPRARSRGSGRSWSNSTGSAAEERREDRATPAFWRERARPWRWRPRPSGVSRRAWARTFSRRCAFSPSAGARLS